MAYGHGLFFLALYPLAACSPLCYCPRPSYRTLRFPGPLWTRLCAGRASLRLAVPRAVVLVLVSDLKICSRAASPRVGSAMAFDAEALRVGGRDQGTTEQAPSPLFCSVLACSGAPTKPTRFVCSAAPYFFWEAGDGGAAEGRGRRPLAWLPSGDRVKTRGGGREKNPENIREVASPTKYLLC